MSDTPSQAQRSSVERHAQTLIGAVMLGLVSWVGYTVTNLNAQFARLDERMAGLERQIDKLEGLADDRYTRREAERSFEALNFRIDENTSFPVNNPKAVDLKSVFGRFK